MLVAAAVAFVVAMGFSAAPAAQAHAQNITAGTPAYVDAGKSGGSGSVFEAASNGIVFADRAEYKASKSKFKGTWKLVKTNQSSTNQALRAAKKYYPNWKRVIKFKKNKTAVEVIDALPNVFAKKKVSYKWMAISKAKGYLIKQNRIIGTMKINGSKLLVAVRSNNGTVKFTFKKM